PIRTATSTTCRTRRGRPGSTWPFRIPSALAGPTWSWPSAASRGEVLKVVIGADHAGIELKNAVVEFLRGRDVEVEDVGTHGNDSVDYPDFASTVSAKVGAGAADFGVLVCGTGLGM